MKSVTKPGQQVVKGLCIGRRFFRRSVQVEQVRVSYPPFMGKPSVVHIVGNSHWIGWSDTMKVLVVGDSVAIINFPEGWDGWLEVTSTISGELVAEINEKEAWQSPVNCPAPVEVAV